MAEYDYGEFTEPLPENSNILAQIRHSALDQKRAEAEVARCEEALDKAKAELRRISEKVLPELMEAAQQKSMTTQDGIVVEVSEHVRAGIKKSVQAQAHHWLNENGEGNLIKRQFIIDFNRDEEQWAAKFERDLKQRKKPVRVERKETVHAQTLGKWVREAMEAGRDIPQDLFGVFRQKFTKIKLPE